MAENGDVMVEIMNMPEINRDIAVQCPYRGCGFIQQISIETRKFVCGECGIAVDYDALSESGGVQVSDHQTV